ncbi:MAG: MMPL family transporter [Thermoprotei archaeon]
MVSLEGLFGSYSRFMASKGKYLLVVWVLLIVVLSPYAATLSHIISYSISVPSSDKESQTAENIIQTDFRGYMASNKTAYLVLEGNDVLSPQFYQEFSRLNSTLFSKLGASGLKSTTSIYGFEYTLLLGFVNGTALAFKDTRIAVNSTNSALHTLASNITKQSADLHSLALNISTLASSMWNLSYATLNLSARAHTLEQNLTNINARMYTLQDEVVSIVNQVDALATKINTTNRQVYALRSQVNLSVQLIYGIPYLYTQVWLGAASATNYTKPTPYVNAVANKTVYTLENGFYGNPEAKLYYDEFYASWWNNTYTQPTANVGSHVYEYADSAVNISLPLFTSYAGLSPQQALFLKWLASYFNITDFQSQTMLNEFTLLYATQGLSAAQAAFVVACFNLGPNPSEQQVDRLALYYATQGLSAAQAAFVEQAFYGVQKEGVEGFVLNYFAQEVNNTDPSLAQELEKQLNLTLDQFLTYAYMLGNPPNQSALGNYTVLIVSRALPQPFAYTLEKQFNTTPSAFVRGVISLGYPPANLSVERLIISLFTPKARAFGNINITHFLEEAYSLGAHPSSSSSLRLAINTTIEGLPSSVQENITRSFGLTPTQYFNAVGSLGYPPSPAALKTLTIELLANNLQENNQSLANNLTSSYNLTLVTFLNGVYSSGEQLNSTQLNSLSAGYTYRLIAQRVQDQPFLEYNLSAVNSTITRIINATNYTQLVDSMMGSVYFTQLPVTPTKGLLYEFVTPSLNTTVVTLNFESPPTDEALAVFEHTATSFNTTEFRVYYTSSQIISKGLQNIVGESQLYAVPFGLAAAIIITGLFFGSPVAALIPILVFGVGAAVGFGLIHLYLGYYEHTTLSYISPVIILILSLGLVTDYSVLILNRYRQELRRGEKGALAKSTRWSGEAVFTSGLTVVLSYIVLSAAHIPLFSDVGAANALIVVSILAAALSFLPALLSIFGKRVFWPKKNFEFKPSTLSRVTRRALRRPRTVLVTLLIFTVLAAVVASTLPVNIDFLALTPAGPGKTGLNQISNNYGGSTLVPTYVVVELPSKLSVGANVFNASELGVLGNLTQTIRAAKGVIAVYGPITPYNYTIPYTQLASFRPVVRSEYASAMLNYVSTDNSSVYFKVVFSGDPFGNAVLSDAVNLRHTLHSVIPAGYTVYVGGSSLDSMAVLSYVFRVLPEIVVLLVASIYVVLLIQLRSAFTPLRLIATILSSIAWTLLLAWIIFYKIGGTSVFVFAPLFLITTMLGVGVDYDIFMMTRVREEARKGLSDEEAILRTAETTAGVVTTLGLILSSVFLGLTLTKIQLVQQIGLSLAIGILLDTFIVWLIYVPSIMVLAKNINWWPSDPRKEPLEEDQ